MSTKKWNYQDLTNDGKAACKAILDNKLEDLEAFIAKYGVEATVDNGTALHYAILHDRPEAVRYLLSQKADPDKVYRQQWTPLTFAIDSEDYRLATWLIESGADVNRKDALNNSPLSKALYHFKGDTSFIVQLLSKGADPYQDLVKSYTPMSLAVSKGIDSLLKNLISLHSPSSIKK